MDDHNEAGSKPNDYWARHDRKLKLRSSMIAGALLGLAAISVARFVYQIPIPLVAYPALITVFVAVWRWVGYSRA